MTELTEIEMSETCGGNPLTLATRMLMGYRSLLNDVESNPDSYSFLLDWYYD